MIADDEGALVLHKGIANHTEDCAIDQLYSNLKELNSRERVCVCVSVLVCVSVSE